MHHWWCQKGVQQILQAACLSAQTADFIV